MTPFGCPFCRPVPRSAAGGRDGTPRPRTIDPHAHYFRESSSTCWPPSKDGPPAPTAFAARRASPSSRGACATGRCLPSSPTWVSASPRWTRPAWTCRSSRSPRRWPIGRRPRSASAFAAPQRRGERRLPRAPRPPTRLHHPTAPGHGSVFARVRARARPSRNRGVFMGTHVAGTDLSDPRLLPVFKAIEAAGLNVFLHPCQTLGGTRLAPYYLGNLLGNPFESAVAAAHLIFGGVLDHCPRLEVHLVHAGGALPVLFGRLDHGHRVRKEARHCRGRRARTSAASPTTRCRTRPRSCAGSRASSAWTG